MFWPGVKGRFVNVKQFYGNVYPSYCDFIFRNGLGQEGFVMGDCGPEEKYKFEWFKLYSSYDEETKQELAVIQKVYNGRLHKLVIKNSVLEDVIIESLSRYNNVWEGLI